MSERKSINEEQLETAKKDKSTSIISATLIGFMAGVVIYGVVKNGFGFFMLIPLLIAYKIYNQKASKNLKKKQGQN